MYLKHTSVSFSLCTGDLNDRFPKRKADGFAVNTVRRGWYMAEPQVGMNKQEG